MKKYLLIIITVFLLLVKVEMVLAQCPCTNTKETSYWEPNLKNSYKTGVYGGYNGNFGNTINGVYVASDKDSIYQIKILIEPHSYGTFVHFQHISFSKKEFTFNNTDVQCSELPNVNDGGWFGRNIFKPKTSINKRFLASEFFKGTTYFTVDNRHFYELYKCEKEYSYGIMDRARELYYRKVSWQPDGNYPEISLFNLGQKDLKKYNKEQLAEMRNEVFARYNYAFKEDGKWYKIFDKLGNYRWNYFKDVSHFITTLEKANLDYTKRFLSADYYDNQQQNDFLDFWQFFRKIVLEQHMEKLKTQMKFPFEVYGEDEEAVIKINKEQFEKAWSIILLQESYDMNYEGKLTTSLTKSIFNLPGAFDDMMIKTKQNFINNLNFARINDEWKMSSANVGFEAYKTIEKLIKNCNSDIETKNQSVENKNNLQEPEIIFPKTGNKAADFLPSLNIYGIQYEAKGDLNKDGLDDIAVVFNHKESNIADRPMLILLQNKDKSFHLDKVSNFAMPIEYTDSDYKIYDTEDISIEDGILKIQLYGIGPSGNVFSDFKYFDNDLILTYIETYNVGAGSWQQLYYNIEKGELSQVITNTMEEIMPTKEKTFKLTKEKYKFESASPDDIIIEAYKKINSE